MKKKAADPPAYRLFINPPVHNTRRRLPGNVRQRIGRSIDKLESNPRPAKSRELRVPVGMETEIGSWEPRRLRVEDFRIVYAIDEAWKEVVVLTIQKRPPYDYDDLERLLVDLVGGARRSP